MGKRQEGVTCNEKELSEKRKRDEPKSGKKLKTWREKEKSLTFKPHCNCQRTAGQARAGVAAQWEFQRGRGSIHSWAICLISCKRICIQFGRQSSPDSRRADVEEGKTEATENSREKCNS